MNSKQRHDFLQQFEIDHDETLVGFGVLGGIFAEGIDLQGEKLIGVGIISVGLPQINLKNNLLRDYFDQLNGQGFSYAYLIPGINNVIQAAGRLIRSSQDNTRSSVWISALITSNTANYYLLFGNYK